MHANEDERISTAVCPKCLMPISGDENILACEDCGIEAAEDCCIHDGLCEDCADDRDFLDHEEDFEFDEDAEEDAF